MKYNRSKIMRRAWEIKRSENVSISEALKAAWAEAKNPTPKTLREEIRLCWDKKTDLISSEHMRIFHPNLFGFHRGNATISLLLYLTTCGLLLQRS